MVIIKKWKKFAFKKADDLFSIYFLTFLKCHFDNEKGKEVED